MCMVFYIWITLLLKTNGCLKVISMSTNSRKRRTSKVPSLRFTLKLLLIMLINRNNSKRLEVPSRKGKRSLSNKH